MTENYERFMRTAKNLQVEGLVYGGPTPQQDELPKPSTTAGTVEAITETKQPREQGRPMITLPPHVAMDLGSSNVEPLVVKIEAASPALNPSLAGIGKFRNFLWLHHLLTFISSIDTKANSEDSKDKKPLKIKKAALKKVNTKSSTPKGTARCSFCFKRYSVKYNHVNDCKENPDRTIHQCHICQKQFSRNYRLKSHLASHTKKVQTMPE